MGVVNQILPYYGNVTVSNLPDIRWISTDGVGSVVFSNLENIISPALDIRAWTQMVNNGDRAYIINWDEQNCYYIECVDKTIPTIKSVAIFQGETKFSIEQNISATQRTYFGLGIDTTTNEGYTNMMPCDMWANRLSCAWSRGGTWLYDLIYNPITYNWQSVPLISGKNGILQSLSTLVNINDGNPVSGASASAVNIIPASVVSGMIQTGASDVIVSFEIPQLTSGTYDSIKLVGKRGGIPRSKTDGEFIETLSDSDTSKTLTGLTKGYTYWFVIFAEDSKGSSSESDPYSYETGEGESVAFFEIDLGQGGKDIVRYDASKTIGNHKQGELYGNYTISNDELNSSDNIYWDYDGSDNPKSIPANCTLTFEYDTYFTSGEGYLDWYVIDANGVEQIYWCFDTQYAFQSNKWYNCKTVAKVENGKITRDKFVLDDVELSCGTDDIKMPCTDTQDSVGISRIYFRLTRPTKMKNISIYYDFSEYHDEGGGGSGSESGDESGDTVSDL